MAQILIVEDDSALRQMLVTLMRRERFDVCEAASAAQLRKCLAAGRFDLLLLDVRLPDSNGFDLLREIRAQSDVAILMLTGLDTPVDRVLGLEFGADDYLCKPFEPRELVARMRSVLRRLQRIPAAAVEAAEDDCYHFAGFKLDLARRSLQKRDGALVPMTSGELDLLAALVRSANRPLSRDQLLDRTRSREWSPYDRSIDVLIGRIRKKIEADPAHPNLIRTVRSIGYVFVGRVERMSPTPS